MDCILNQYIVRIRWCVVSSCLCLLLVGTSHAASDCNILHAHLDAAGGVIAVDQLQAAVMDEAIYPAGAMRSAMEGRWGACCQQNKLPDALCAQAPAARPDSPALLAVYHLEDVAVARLSDDIVYGDVSLVDPLASERREWVRDNTLASKGMAAGQVYEQASDERFWGTISDPVAFPFATYGLPKLCSRLQGSEGLSLRDKHHSVCDIAYCAYDRIRGTTYATSPLIQEDHLALRQWYDGCQERSIARIGNAIQSVRLSMTHAAMQQLNYAMEQYTKTYSMGTLWKRLLHKINQQQLWFVEIVRKVVEGTKICQV